MIDSKLSTELKELYLSAGKHSNYQLLPRYLWNEPALKEILKFSKYEKERFDFILKHLSLTNKKILDIGGNTGFFTFESIYLKAKEVYYFENNQNHANFVRKIAEYLNIKNLNIFPICYNFQQLQIKQKTDVTFLLNVLHHVGDDFQKNRINNVNDALKSISEILKSFKYKTIYLVFQIGFCWQGNICAPLFKNGTKAELINFITSSIKDDFDIVSIGIPEKQNNKIIYKEKSVSNIKRIDVLGEFLNRPIFILKSKET